MFNKKYFGYRFRIPLGNNALILFIFKFYIHSEYIPFFLSFNSKSVFVSEKYREKTNSGELL